MRVGGQTDGLVRIPGGTADHAGMGLLISPLLVLTCAHVVNAALGRDLASQVRPISSDTVDVLFPFALGSKPLKARVVDWAPPKEFSGDSALLELEHSAPADAGLGTFSVVAPDQLTGSKVSVFGQERGGEVGRHEPAVLANRVSGGWWEIDARQNPESIRPGFSGAPVFDEKRRAMVGIVTRVSKDPKRGRAYMIRTEQLLSDLPALKGEHNRTSFGSQMALRILTAIVSLICILFIMESTSNHDLLGIPFIANSSVLAGYFGLILVGFLAPVLAWLAWRHAMSYRARAWYQRVPAIGSPDPGSSLDNSRVVAAFTLALLLGLPIGSQAHFYRNAFGWFRDNTAYAIMIYESDFGIKANASGDSSRVCADSAKRICPHEDAGLWSLVIGENGESPFWDNRYHLADTGRPDLVEGGLPSVTFWPILAPTVLIALTILNLVFAAATIVDLFLPRRLRVYPRLPVQSAKAARVAPT